jgi:hypothetical protein
MALENPEREFETGKDEFWFAAIGNLYANFKRTFDEYQDVSLGLIRKLNTHYDKMVTDAQQHDNARQTTANLALSNAVDTANLVNKQAVAHRDIAHDRIWNIDEVSGLSAKSGVQADAFVALLAKAVADILKEQAE